MAMSTNNESLISEEQLRYATLLGWGARSGLLVLTITFLAYMFGFIPAHVPLDQMPNYWNLSSHEYIQQTGSPVGWGWLTRMSDGDYASLFGIAWLSGCSLVCLVAVMPIYSRRGDKIFVGLCAAALAVQLLAASGILRTGGH